MDLFHIAVYAGLFFGGIVVGITVGRHSTKANAYYDSLKDRAERAEARLRELGQ